DVVLAIARDGQALVLARASAGTTTSSPPTASFPIVLAPARVGLRGVALGRVRFAGVGADKLGSPDLARAARDGLRALVAPVASGIAARALEEARRYAMLRQQFGKAIARFQGVQFLVAQILVARQGCHALARALAEAAM